MVSLLK
jgi:hypothetical protein